MTTQILLIEEALTARSIYFDQSAMNPPTDRYVCWLDVMGSGNTMGRSMAIAANFIMKLHVAALESRGSSTGIELYPMIDGLYVCSETLEAMFPFLRRVLIRLAVTFVSEPDPIYRFIVRGGLAYGPVTRQLDVQEGSAILTSNPDYCRRILLGLPLAQAYDEERKGAPPFGVAIHESARAFGRIGGNPLSGRYWRWWDSSKPGPNSNLASILEQELHRYYGWCIKHSAALGYERDRILFHWKLARDYFSDERGW